MRYQKVHWQHEPDQFPEIIYSEVDEDGWEARKVEVFHGGRLCYADDVRDTGPTRLSDKQLPDLASVNAQAGFSAVELTKAEFEQIWLRATEDA